MDTGMGMRTVHALVAEHPESTLEPLLIVPRDSSASKSQALGHLWGISAIIMVNTFLMSLLMLAVEVGEPQVVNCVNAMREHSLLPIALVEAGGATITVRSQLVCAAWADGSL
jgi:hypothetical protein